MRKVQTKQMTRRVLSVLLVLCMVFAMIPAESIFAAAKRVTKDDNGNVTTSEYNTVKNGKTLSRIRKVIKENASSAATVTTGAAKGTDGNPFLILEVVPALDFSSIGYLVADCEPVDMEMLRGNAMAIKDLTGSEDGGDFFGFGKWTKIAGNLFFFPDEAEGQITFYQNTNLTATDKTAEEGGVEAGKSKLRFTTDEWNAKEKTEAKEIYGYYEVVKQGTGTFILKEEASTDEEGNPITVRSIVKADPLNSAEVAQTTLVWHTTNTYLMNQYRSEGMFNNLYLDLEANLNSAVYFPRLKIDSQEYIGNRFYTVRKANTSDPYYDVTGCLYNYESYDLLVKKSIVAKEADAKNYSVTVKTITAEDLKSNQAWVDKADLIYFNADLKLFYDKDNDGTQDEDEAGLLDLWRGKNVNDATMNRFNLPKSTSTTKGFRGTQELDAESTYKILKRVSKYSNYVALVIDSICLDLDYTDVMTARTYSRYRLDRTQIDSGNGATGYKNNLAKLWLACTSANPGFALKYFFDGGTQASGASVSPKSRFTVDGEGIMRFNNPLMTEDEKLYWSGVSFYCADDRYSGSENSYKKAYWKNYAGDTLHEYFDGSWHKEDDYYVQGHVFVTPTGTGLVDGYAKAYDSSKLLYGSDWGAEDKYDDFNFFLEKYEKVSFKANKANSALAMKYVIDAGQLVNYYFDNSMTILDLEPSVKMAADGVSYEWNFDGSDVIKLIPKRIGTDTSISKIEHQVMQQFVSKNEDMNSKYDLIYIGDYTGGLWTGNDLVEAEFASSTVIGQEPYTVMEKIWKPNAGQSKNTKYYENSDGYFDDGKRKARRVRTEWQGSGWNWYEVGYEMGYTASQGKEEEVPTTKYRDILGVDGATAGADRTDFVDNSMDGLVYFHIGDTLNINTSKRDDNGYWTNEAGFLGTSSTVTRQAGNDLTYKKQKKLVEYLLAEYPIVIADTLYNNQTMVHPYVDQSSQCVMKQFLDNYHPEKPGVEYSYYTKDMLDKIDRMVSNRLKGRAQILSGPKVYDSSVADVNARYLAETDGQPVLQFEVKVPNKTDYAYRVFVDRNKDSVFTEDWTNDEKNEVITPRMVPITELESTIQVKMPDKWVGFVQWRIEVVNKENVYKRYSLEGCSAVKAQTGEHVSPDRAVQKIVALQIIPTHSTGGNKENPGTLVDLSNNTLNGKRSTSRSNANWQGLYNDVKDFDITVVKMTWRQFMQVFKSSYEAHTPFKFDMGSPINITDDASSNPNKAVLNTIETTPLAFRDYNTNQYSSELITVTGDAANDYYTLGDFNMIVVGFDDAYGFTDMINTYGNAEYLYYFAAKGCSILFTHDTTSAYTNPNNSVFNLGWTSINVNSPWKEIESRRYGYTANTMMRELMGMNRYMQYSGYLSDDDYFRDGLKNNIQNYINNNVSYDPGYVGSSKNGLQGYSLYNTICYSCAGNNDGKTGRIQNKYMVLNPKNDKKLYSGNSAGGTNSPYYGNTLSQVVTRVNEGQITQYPYTINMDFVVGETHGQWWQLNMEDNDLTVWYTLQDPAMSSLANDSRVNGGYKKRETANNNSRYIALMYSAVPQDAANNYYIFSKGNIFYSGVGHSAVANGEEQRLFVNTLVAAYRPKYGLPFIQVTSTEANLTKPSPNRTYSITLPVDYLYNEDGSYAGTEVLLSEGDFSDSTYAYVKFKAMDNNGCTEIFTTAVYDDAGAEELTIYPSLASARSGGASSVPKLHGDYKLTVGEEYYVRYKLSNLDIGKVKIRFDSYNTRITTGEKDSTYVEFSSQPLFRLD